MRMQWIVLWLPSPANVLFLFHLNKFEFVMLLLSTLRLLGLSFPIVLVILSSSPLISCMKLLRSPCVMITSSSLHGVIGSVEITITKSVQLLSHLLLLFFLFCLIHQLSPTRFLCTLKRLPWQLLHNFLQVTTLSLDVQEDQHAPLESSPFLVSSLPDIIHITIESHRYISFSFFFCSCHFIQVLLHTFQFCFHRPNSSIESCLVRLQSDISPITTSFLP